MIENDFIAAVLAFRYFFIIRLRTSLYRIFYFVFKTVPLIYRLVLDSFLPVIYGDLLVSVMNITDKLSKDIINHYLSDCI